MVFDIAREQSILYGGTFGSIRFGDTWSWDGETWTLLYEPGPPARYVTAAAYDVVRGQTILFGGYADGYANDTWLLPSPLNILRDPISRLGVLHDSVQFLVEALGSTPQLFQWRKNGIPIVDNNRIHGSTGNILTIDQLEFADAGTFDVLISNECGEQLSDAAELSIRCLPDLNANGQIELSDLTILLSHFGECTGDENFYPDADLDRRGCVDLPDLTLLISAFGTECP